jgi:predicted methyltransferase
MKKRVLFMILGLFVSGCAVTPKPVEKSDLSSILNLPHRSEENRKRDQYRHPQETLEFFEVQPQMTVVEISPGRGWYTEILAPYLKSEGKLYLAIFSDTTSRDYYVEMNKALKDKIAKDPEIYGDVVYTTFEVPDSIGPVAPEGTADRVLTFRNAHNWMKQGKLQESLKAFHKALKPDGILGIVEHRSKLKKKQDPKAESGYVREDYLIKEAKKAGFELIATSEINANANDSTDHPEGVWTLPPSLKLKDKDRAKYEAIGESDRMTLKFRRK